MKLPKISSKPSTSSFGVGNILGLVFILIGVLLILALINFNLPIDLSNFETILEYSAAIGSILGGIAMLFRKNETELNAK